MPYTEEQVDAIRQGLELAAFQHTYESLPLAEGEEFSAVYSLGGTAPTVTINCVLKVSKSYDSEDEQFKIGWTGIVGAGGDLTP